MCEIITFDPEQHSNEMITDIAVQIEEEQGHGLGIVSVHESPDGFEYDVWKQTYPDWFDMHKFLERQREKGAWRFVLHGRRKTAGEVCHKNAHPLHVDCQHCDFEWVVHNGSVRNHHNIRGGLTSSGHTFETDVDSEVIAHKVKELPDSIDNHKTTTYSFTGNLNYLLFAPDGIFIHVTSKYHLTDDMLMTCSRTSKMSGAGAMGYEYGTDNEWMLVTPGDNGPEFQTKERTTWSGRTASTSGTRRSSRASRNSRFSGNYGRAGEGVEAGNDKNPTSQYTVTYTNHAAFDNIIAIKVAPGVMRIIDDYIDEEEYVFRDEQPRLYYYYAPEEVPANIDYLEELAQRDQSELTDYNEPQPADNEDEDAIEDEVVSETTRAVANTINNLTVEEVQEFQQEIRESWRQGRLRATTQDE